MWRQNSNPFKKPPIPKGVIENAIKESPSMIKASEYVGCAYNTFKKYAKLYGLWNPNQSGKGISKNKKSFREFDMDIKKIQKTFEKK